MDLSPQHTSYSANSTRDRIKKSPRWDNEDGVAATVGAIMGLLVFLAFMGIFTNQFVPVWMSDNESAHMSTAIEQFINLKSSIDVSISNYPNSLVAPSPIYVPITLSSAGIPVFAGPTAGILTLSPNMITSKTNFNLSYVWTTDGVRPYTIDPRYDGHVGGYLELYSPNRYFVEQKIIYKAGAVVLNQSDGEFVLAGPQFKITNAGPVSSPSFVVKLTQVSVEGTNKTIGGTGSKGITAELQFANSVAYVRSSGAWRSWTGAPPRRRAPCAGLVLHPAIPMSRPHAQSRCALVEIANRDADHRELSPLPAGM